MSVKDKGHLIVKLIFGTLAGGFAAFGLWQAVTAETKATMMVASMMTMIGMLAFTDCFRKDR